MKRRALIDTLRAAHGPVALLREEFELLADAVEEADSSHRSFIECECPCVIDGEESRGARDGWYDTSRALDGLGDSYEMPAEERASIDKVLSAPDCDRTIANLGTLDDLGDAVRRAWEQLKAERSVA